MKSKDLFWWFIILIGMIHIFYHGVFILFAPYGWYLNTKNFDFVYLDTVDDGCIIESDGYFYYEGIPFEYGLEYGYSIRNLCGYIALYSTNRETTTTVPASTYLNKPDHYYIHCPCSVPLILLHHISPLPEIVINDTLFFK